MISKFHKDDGTSRLAVVLNGSPLFTGGAGSGESEIRRWIIENDWPEAIIGLPDQIFYNTGISTYIWIVTSQKAKQRRGRVQLIDATGMFEKMRRSLGNKRNLIPEDATNEITRIFGEMRESEVSKIFDNADFGYQRITVERPQNKFLYRHIFEMVLTEVIERLLDDSGSEGHMYSRGILQNWPRYGRYG